MRCLLGHEVHLQVVVFSLSNKITTTKVVHCCHSLLLPFLFVSPVHKVCPLQPAGLADDGHFLLVFSL